MFENQREFGESKTLQLKLIKFDNQPYLLSHSSNCYHQSKTDVPGFAFTESFQFPFLMTSAKLLLSGLCEYLFSWATKEFMLSVAIKNSIKFYFLYLSHVDWAKRGVEERSKEY